MMVKIAACRHIHFRLCRRADGRREINMKKTNKIIGGIVVTSLAASIIGGYYKFEAEKMLCRVFMHHRVDLRQYFKRQSQRCVGK